MAGFTSEKEITMPFTKRYDSFEVRSLMQTSEGTASPATGAAAHARSLHGGIVGVGGAAATTASMMHRTHKAAGESNKSFKRRGGVVQTSSFKNVLQQSSAVTQALNSPMGQAVMRVFDRAPTLSLRATLEVAGIIEAGFLPASGIPLAKTVHKNDTKVTTGGGDGVRVIVDRGANSQKMTIQTCFPLIGCTGSSYKVEALPGTLVIEQG
jgi:hypothetical protein